MRFSPQLNPLIYFITALLVFSCAKQPETIVVERGPTTSTEEKDLTDTVQTDTQADFRKLVIGELNPIPSLDPLFAMNASSQRINQILFEGLVRYNSTGEVVPTLAKRWNISNDSLSYTFTLRSNAFYHDSEIFGSGIGRKVLASDVKFVFERMAKITVPEKGAIHFMNIRGFDPFFQEQHNIFNPRLRRLNEISGITVRNDSTVIFDLVEKDPDFLKKLATPYAVIYPREAVSGSDSFKPIGTGPFEISQQRGDSVYIFSDNNNYWMQQENNSTPSLDRVDVIVNQNETKLFIELANREVHLLPELGPATLASILDPGGNLTIAYDELYTFGKTDGKFHYAINYYPGSDTPKNEVNATLFQVDFSNMFSDIPGTILQFSSDIQIENGQELPANTVDNLKITFTDDPYLIRVIKVLSRNLGEVNSDLQLFNIRTPNRNTELFWTLGMPYYPTQKMELENAVNMLSLTVNHSYIHIKEVRNLSFNQYPWWIDLREVSIPELESL